MRLIYFRIMKPQRTTLASIPGASLSSAKIKIFFGFLVTCGLYLRCEESIAENRRILLYRRRLPWSVPPGVAHYAVPVDGCILFLEKLAPNEPMDVGE